MNALESALIAIDHETIDYTEPAQHLVAAKTRALLRGYDAMWRHGDYEPVDVEVTLTGPIVNQETGRPARTLTQAGKLDVIAKRQGRLVLMDHKTCSQDISPGAPYWQQLAVESQVSHYMLLGWLNGMKFDDAVWDVIRKPSISPKKLTKAMKASTVAERKYCGVALSHATLDALQVDDRETYEMYEARLTDDCINVRPGWYFQRQSVPRFDAELLEYAGELWQHSKAILDERKRKLPVRNSGACMLYGSPCIFLGVCSGHDSIESDNWRIKRTVHNELPDLDNETDTRNVLTNSRIRCFQTCRRKHFYQYELGVERHDAEEKEALFFGSLVHVGLEAWFLSLKGDDNETS